MKKPFLIKCLANLVLFSLLSLVLTWLLEFRYFSGDASAATDFMFSNPRVFLLNAWFMFLILVAISSLIGSVFRGAGFTAAAVLIIGYIHINKFATRNTPLLPEDFQLATEAAGLAKFVSIESIIQLAISVVSVLIIGEVLARWIGHYFSFAPAQAPAALDSARQNSSAPATDHQPIAANRQPSAVRQFLRRHLVLPRATIIIVTNFIFLASGSFVIYHGSSRSEEIDWLGTTFVAGDQTENYDTNGFILGFLYNLSRIQPAEPEGYSESAIAGIKSTYEAEAASANARRTSLTDADYNIIVILGESTVDPTELAKYYPYSGGEVAPNLARLLREYPSGHLYSPDYGGGTANIEFEALTGLTNYWLATVPYTNLIAHSGYTPSIATYARDHGYRTTAVHTYTAGMYKRNVVLPYEGIDEFRTASDLKLQTRDGDSQYLNDRALYHEVLDLLGEDQKQFVFAITMQTHAPYSESAYPSYDYRLTGSAKHSREIEIYLQGLHAADSYLGEFISALDSSPEKTVVLFFGDHAPGILDELAKSSDPVKIAAAHSTPYFVYANFDLAATSQSLPTTTPNCLTSTMLDLLNAEKPALGYLAGEVCGETPILTPLYLAEPPSTTTLTDYELVTYDLLGGQKYWL